MNLRICALFHPATTHLTERGPLPMLQLLALSRMSAHPSLSFAAHHPGRAGKPRVRGAIFLLTVIALALGCQPGQARPQLLYSLDTTCAVEGAAPVPCRVEALDAQEATLYRHTIGATTHTLRISDQPSRLTLWDAGTRSWKPLRNAAVRFSTNTLCLNDQALCVVNPNYLNSLLQERPDFRGRDLVRVHFAANGRVDVICYDTGCDLLAQRKEAT